MKTFTQHALNIGVVGLLALSTGACTAETTDVEESLGTNVEDLVVGGFTTFSQIPGGTFNSAPAVSARGTNALDIYARGLDNQIWGNFWSTASGWFGWSPLPGGGTFSSKPCATATTNGSEQFVAAKGMDNKIYVQPWKLGSGWGALGVVGASTFDTAPSLAYANGTLHLFARKSDQSVYWSQNNISAGYNVANWTAFAAIPGGSVLSEPAAVFDGFNVVVAARGGDSFFWTTKLSGASSWSAWSQIPGGTFQFAPALSSWGSGHLDVFGTGMDNRIYFNSRDGGGFIGYQAIPNATFTSAPTAWSSQGNTNRIRLAAKGGDNAIWLSSYIQ